jgi:hypothetical protein
VGGSRPVAISRKLLRLGKIFLPGRVKVFETGKVFEMQNGTYFPGTPICLAGTTAALRALPWWPVPSLRRAEGLHSLLQDWDLGNRPRQPQRRRGRPQACDPSQFGPDYALVITLRQLAIPDTVFTWAVIC